jgi:DNA polymerase-3 subunit beta
MKVDRRALSLALSHLIHVADTRQVLEILGHVLLEASGGLLTITATDGTTTVDHEMLADGDLVVALPARMLHVLVKPDNRRDAGDVKIEPLDEPSASVVVEGLSTKLSTMDPADFPATPVDTRLAWSIQAICPAQSMRAALDYVLPAASTDEQRPHLNCICLDGGRMMATDGHRLHAADIPTNLPEPMLLPLQAARIAKRLLGSDDLAIIAKSRDTVRIRAGQWQMDTRLVDATFPPVERVIPSGDQPVHVTVQQALLAKSLARVAKLARDNTVRVTVNGRIQLTAEDPDLGEAHVIVPIQETNHEGDDLVIGVNPAYLRDATAARGETLELGFSGARDALRIEAPGKLAVVMPTRL